ncbi:hypothetical protein ROLI_015010 [Roseobacter fucihabitans]|uniref:GAF domain-containing protein n=1 Tax=Roseobacter fucihabitans TaxID=1537242 RepID=A0ABZ2BR02_9RHOB|nr:GAF domain-containing protein [Roseobacter litoralis]MBC6965456.1 hypothetical protein [Roseobacter litoralis]
MTEQFSMVSVRLEAISKDLNTAATFFFASPTSALGSPKQGDNKTAHHDQITQRQAHQLGDYVFDLHKPLFIDDIYAHPLIVRNDILFGHRIRAFAGTPMIDSLGRKSGVLCTVDTKKRLWSAQDGAVLQAFSRSLQSNVDSYERA